MKELKLIRTNFLADAVLGVLSLDNVPIGLTLENPELYIPAGRYECRSHNWNRGKSVVPALIVYDRGDDKLRVYDPRLGRYREGILFHYGNTKADTQGCILTGKMFGKLKIDNNFVPAVLNSTDTHHQLIKQVSDQRITSLSVINADSHYRFEFTVPGNPLGKQRPRKGKYGNFYTPKPTQDYEKLIAMYFIKNFGKPIKPPFASDEKVFIDLDIYFTRKHSRSDPNNVNRLVADALEGLVYKNDKMVGGFTDFYIDPENPRIEVKIRGEYD